jgi:hypothetical protein
MSNLNIAQQLSHRQNTITNNNFNNENINLIGNNINTNIIPNEFQSSQLQEYIINPGGNAIIIQDSNNANISINEEFSSRRDTVLNNNNNINLYPEQNVGIHPRNSLSSSTMFHCNICSQQFNTASEYQLHFTYCGDFRNTRMMHNSINEILHLVDSLNRQLLTNNHLNILTMLGMDDPEEATEYIDWIYYKTQDENVIWKKLGKVNISKEEIKNISQKNIDFIVEEKYFLKRIWLLNYINTKIYDKSNTNTTLVISRENVLEESFNQFMTTKELDLRKAVQVFFIDEIAHDIGGVYREWYTILFESIFSIEQCFFFKVDNRCIGKNSFFIPTNLPKMHKDNFLDYYEFIGKLIAKALFDKITIKTSFNLILIKYLLGTNSYNMSLEDLKYLDNEVNFKNLFKSFSITLQ